ncbi:MAG: YdeI/OmpD-associated family protein [Cognatishimia sp.]|uniref:YdeI/OmpD-associated family protein n=1 Tax=Cognatishimia sp. TaxID=2211648 RepID=UPI003B8B0672
MQNLQFFYDQDAFTEWFENGPSVNEMWVGYYKKHSGKPGLTWSDSVDVALCYGWTDGIRKTIDEDSYRIRFTPRKPNSVWSAVNVDKAHKLIKDGRMKSKGLELFQCRKDKIGYRVSDRNIHLSESFMDQLKANAKAWAFFDTLAPSYKRESIWWIMSAKKEQTRRNRLEILISSSAEGLKIPQLRKKI